MELITLRAAARKYEVSPGTLSRWAKRDAVRVVRAGSRGVPTVLDEASVLAAVDAYRAAPGKGAHTLARYRWRGAA